ncbi:MULTISPECIES: abortive infection family protein [Coriobacteriia]|uniref:Abortive infection protein-like C-terminal domain-containing protein n=2 Tax=Coriobacteriia TaxID=84998 RepID=A0A7W5GNY0_9ACTN|nr:MULTISPECIES: abortive infection family protein [Coriobacteriia]MBB3170805.1 hypothetical protein [Parvibacter caecicola]MCR2042454.1 abortive infection family protein [Parvibacter caecicola]MVX60865.1 hypothetical protein [Adlercreutzia mucosicola]RNL10310.1 hypothetical protein DMP11_07415 [Parvibacter caecicola]
MEDEYKDISPLYMQRLKGRVENALWNLFEGSKYRQVEEYVRRWHEDDGSFWENFCVFEKDGHIDLGRTLAGMPNDTLIKMAADIGVETPGMLPCIPIMKNILNQNNTNAYANFERAVKDVYDHPDQSVALAASTLEGLFKTILQNSDPSIRVKNLSLSDLTGKVVKQLIGDCDASAPQEIRTLASQLRGLGSTIDDLRSDKSTAHGKAAGDYVVDDSLWAETVVNATATLGLLLWRLYERSCTGAKAAPVVQPTPVYDDDIPF